MEYIATAALVVGASALVFIAGELSLLRGAVIEYMKCPLTVILSQTDRDFLANYRRYAPRAKKETV